ncbi:MAG: hypothetical protein H0V76_10835 [Blastocatellia bacterium]|nr:hypothetical protein [Blastocatellia bacterium]
MFSVLTQPTYPKAAIGIEKEAVTAMSLRRQGGAFGIRRAATVELPVNLITPNFFDSNISNPRELQVMLEEAVASAGLLEQKNWSVSLPSSTARSAILTLEKSATSGADVSEVIDWKAEQTFGAPAGEMRVTRTKIASDRDGKDRYFATAVKLSVVDEFETVFEGLGWKAGLILPRIVSESNWLLSKNGVGDSLLISSQSDGFTAVVIRGGEPNVVRSVTCKVEERNDEIYRLLMFYHDRFAAEESGLLNRLLLVGSDLIPEAIKDISSEALGHALKVMRPEDVGFSFPGNLRFDDLAAPGGLARMGWQ